MTDDAKIEDQLPQIAVGIPGPWADLDEAMTAIIHEADDRYVGVELNKAEHGMDGAGLQDQETNWACLVQSMPRNPSLETGFQVMGHGRTTPRDAKKVARHRTVLVLMAPGGSVETARYMMDAITVAVKAGGLGVIIESTGIAHAPHDWLKLAEGGDEAGGLYWAYTATIGPKGPNKRTIYTCGMHNLGLRDAITDMFDDPQEALFVIHNFLGYVYQSGIPVADGDVIGDEDGPKFRVFMEPCRTYPPEDLFHNPYGMWRIAPAPE